MKETIMEYSIEEFDKAKSKIMNYIMYKKRTEHEVRTKFSKTIEENLLNDIIEYVKEAKYLNDSDYIQKTINEYKILKSLSIKEVKYKLISKGIKNNLIEDYISENYDMLNDFELQSAQKIFHKKQHTQEVEEIQNYLRRKGYQEENIKQAIESIN